MGDPIRILIVALSSLVLASCSDSNTINQPPAPTPTALVVVSGNNQMGTVDQALGAAILVQVNDQFGDPMASVDVGFAVTLGGGQVAAASVSTGGDGRASTNWTLGTTAGASHRVPPAPVLPLHQPAQHGHGLHQRRGKRRLRRW